MAFKSEDEIRDWAATVEIDHLDFPTPPNFRCWDIVRELHEIDSVDWTDIVEMASTFDGGVFLRWNWTSDKMFEIELFPDTYEVGLVVDLRKRTQGVPETLHTYCTCVQNAHDILSVINLILRRFQGTSLETVE